MRWLHLGFIGLRWRVVLPTLLIFALTTATFAWMQRRDIERDAAREYAAARDRHHLLIEQLLSETGQRMQTLAAVFANPPGIIQGLQGSTSSRELKVIESLWNELHIHADLESVTMFDTAGRALLAWGRQDLQAPAAALATGALRREMPMQALVCPSDCVLQTAVPLMLRGRLAGTLVLSAGLHDVILAFRRIAGAELALVAQGRALPHQLYLPALQARLISVSGDPSNTQLLLQATALPEPGEYQVSTGSRHYRLQAYHPPRAQGQAWFIVIMDITAQSHRREQALREHLYVAAAVLTIASVALLMMLASALQRLRQLGRAMPLFGAGRLSEASAHLPAPRRWMRDEIDVLAEVMRRAAEDLSRLQEQNQQQMHLLARQAEVLQQERDFIAHLLDTAPIPIVNHTTDGQIALCNAYAVRLSGREASELHRLGFITTFFTPEQQVSLRQLLTGTQGESIVHSEGCVQRPDGSTREVVWFHSPFGRADDQRADWLSVGLDVTAHRQAEQRLLHLLDHDPVTGLLNRNAFQRELGRLLAAPDGQGVLLVCDIDEFKAANEVGGQERGDALLALVAHKIQDLTPILSARLASDEFALYYTGMSLAEAIVLARGLNQALVGIGATLGLPKHSFTVCVGIAQAQGPHAQAEDLLTQANAALSQARRRGEGSWHVYDANDPYVIDQGRRLLWSVEIDRALAVGEQRLLLHYQPVQELRTGRIAHWEALIRMRSSDGRLILPGQFIGVAEATGQIRRIDRWVCEHVTALLQTHPDLCLAINLSGRSLDDEDILETLRHGLVESGVSGERLIIEITETAALADIKASARLMDRYRALGFRFCLDDFGVGYTSFQYLKELPVDAVKIDGSFIIGLKRNQDDQIFVKTLTEAVHGFGKQVVAEFVEDAETLDLLQAFGVDYAQGYHIGRPAARPDLAVAA
ncbi:MAG: EAL domain-containing protein [Burkholderiales bacterium]|nr:EAL domain-containing protein [Burkholderiales bacterium]